jgi:hypothetical protein
VKNLLNVLFVELRVQSFELPKSISSVANHYITKLECTRKVTDFERADYCLFLLCLDRSSLATICWQRVAAFLPRALISRCAISTRAPYLPPVYSSSARPSPLLRLVKIIEIVKMLNSRIYRAVRIEAESRLRFLSRSAPRSLALVSFCSVCAQLAVRIKLRFYIGDTVLYYRGYLTGIL